MFIIWVNLKSKQFFKKMYPILSHMCTYDHNFRLYSKLHLPLHTHDPFPERRYDFQHDPQGPDSRWIPLAFIKKKNRSGVIFVRNGSWQCLSYNVILENIITCEYFALGNRSNFKHNEPNTVSKSTVLCQTKAKHDTYRLIVPTTRNYKSWVFNAWCVIPRLLKWVNVSSLVLASF